VAFNGDAEMTTFYMIAVEECDIMSHSDWGKTHFDTELERIKKYRDEFHPTWKIFTIIFKEIQ